jgi:raffinose/stachyose/melibiose transport system substrate-binding protein
MKKLVRLFVLVALVVVMVAPTVASAQDPVTIRWWHIATAEADAAIFQGIADAYMEAHPNVTIEITILENEAFKTQLTTAHAAGDPPDLFHLGGGGLWNYANAGMLRDISAELEGEW